MLLFCVVSSDVCKYVLFFIVFMLCMFVCCFVFRHVPLVVVFLDSFRVVVFLYLSLFVAGVLTFVVRLACMFEGTIETCTTTKLSSCLDSLLECLRASLGSLVGFL